MVGGEDDELGPRAPKQPEHVGPARVLAFHGLEANLLEARLPELSTHVLGGKAAARRAQGVRPEGRELRSMAQRRFSIEGKGRGEEQGRERQHERAL